MGAEVQYRFHKISQRDVTTGLGKSSPRDQPN